MDRDTRAKALGYAAKTVLSAAFLAACGGSSDATTDDTNADVGTDDEIVARAPACKKGLAKLKEVFPTGDKSFWNHLKVDPALKGNADVTACCESIVKSSSDSANLSKIQKFRTAGCCAADYTAESGTPNGNAAAGACTPWGPPVPPAMVA